MKCSELNYFTCEEVSSFTCDQLNSDKQDLLLKIARGEIIVSDQAWEKVRVLCENSIRLYNSIAPESKKFEIQSKSNWGTALSNIGSIASIISFFSGLFNPTSVTNVTNNYIENNFYINEDIQHTLEYNIDEILNILEIHEEIL